LYLAAAVFGAFLLLALLSIIVRVERNLRPLAHLADKAQEAK
jgi:HAMP domain-containing protein